MHKTNQQSFIVAQQRQKAFESFQVVADESFLQDEDPNITNIQKVDVKFQNIFDNLLKKMWEAQQASDVSEYERFINWMSLQRENWKI